MLLPLKKKHSLPVTTYHVVVPRSKEDVQLQTAESVERPCEGSRERCSLSSGLRLLSGGFQSALWSHVELRGVRPCSQHHLLNSQLPGLVLCLHSTKYK